jgi:hypothetical protein
MTQRTNWVGNLYLKLQNNKLTILYGYDCGWDMSNLPRSSSVQRSMDLLGISEEMATRNWHRYLFEGDRKELFQKWAAKLNLFRFVRAAGGHANDADELVVAFRYRSFGEVEKFLNSIGVELVKFSEEPSQPEPGVSYQGDEYKNFPSLVPGTTWIKQPGHCTIDGIKVFLWCDLESKLKFHLFDEKYVISEASFQDAEILEKTLASCPLERVEPPFDNDHCICPKYHPEFFGVKS